MKERPILFSGPMVCAILAGAKTQTRRVVRDAAGAFWDHGAYTPSVAGDRIVWQTSASGADVSLAPTQRCPFGASGDRLWVRETFNVARPTRDSEGIIDDELAWRGPLRQDPRGKRLCDDWCVGYAADGCDGTMRPSIHMPRWASRITLEVTGVRVERVQDITEEDAKAEGAPARANGIDDACAFGLRHVCGFAKLWDSINGKRAPWGSNPWVWVVEFRMVKP